MPRFFRSGASASSKNKNAAAASLPNKTTAMTTTTTTTKTTIASPNDFRSRAPSPRNFLRRTPATSDNGRRRAKSADSPRVVALLRQLSSGRSTDSASNNNSTKEEVFRVSVVPVQGGQGDEARDHPPIHTGVLRIRSFDRNPKIDAPPRRPITPSFLMRRRRTTNPSSRNTSPASSAASEDYHNHPNYPSYRYSNGNNIKMHKNKSSASISSSDSTIKQSCRSPAREKRRNLEPNGTYKTGDILGLRRNSSEERLRRSGGSSSNNSPIRRSNTPPSGNNSNNSNLATTPPRTNRIGSNHFPELVGEPACTPPRIVSTERKKMRFRSDAIANKVNKARSTTPKRSAEPKRTMATPRSRKPKEMDDRMCQVDPTFRDFADAISFGLFSFCQVSFDDVDDHQDYDEISRTWSEDSQELSNDGTRDLMSYIDDDDDGRGTTASYSDDGRATPLSYDLVSEDTAILTTK